MRTKVNDGELRDLQREHSRLIKEYEDIIKQKVGIFTQMLGNLQQLQEGNDKAILNEEEIAEVKLQIEVWERDIYQKKRVEMDVHVDILNTHGLIDQVQDDINARNQNIAQLQKELEDATAELEDFKDDCGERDAKIAELQKQVEDLKEERARLERELAEKREAEAMQPKPVAVAAPSKYKAQKGDPVDELMAHWINQYQLDVPLVRLDDKTVGEYRRYLFGTKKI